MPIHPVKNFETSHDVPEGLVLGPNDGEKLSRRWGHPFYIKVDRLNGGAEQFSVGSEQLFPGDLIHMHRHSDSEEIVIINAGRGLVFLGDKKITIGPGSLIFIPRQIWHGFENTGTEAIHLLWIFPKQGMEKYFRATSVPVEQYAPPLMSEELNRIRVNHRDSVEYKDINLDHYTTQKTLL